MSARSAWTKALSGPAVAPAGSKPAKRASTKSTLQALAAAQKQRPTKKELYARYLSDLEAVVSHDQSIPDVQVIPMLAVPKPRMSQRDAWSSRPVVERYKAFCDEIRLRGARLPYAYRLEFVLPMPASWPEDLKEEMDGKLHLLTPDTSNLQKATEDALVKQDQVIHTLSATKRWGRVPSITIRKIPFDQKES